MTKVSALESQVLMQEEWDDYFETLKQNNRDKLEEIFLDASKKERSVMLNGWFSYQDKIPSKSAVLGRMSRPLLVAVMIGAKEAAEFLIKNGADVSQENSFQENLFHSLVAASSFEIITESKAASLYKWFQTVMEKTLLCDLLMHENADGLRPMEMAANLGCLLLYEEIQLTPGVYVLKSRKVGIYTEQWIDITDYESSKKGHRGTKSPPSLLALLDKNVANNKKHGNILECDIVLLWMRRKMKALSRSFVVTGILFTLFHVLYFIYITNPHNRKQETGKMSFTNSSQNNDMENCEHQPLYFQVGDTFYTFLTVFILAHSTLHVAFGSLGMASFMVNSWFYRNNLLGRKQLFVSFDIYLLYVSTNASFIIVVVLTYLMEHHVILNVLVFCTSIGSVWIGLYLLQISSAIGHFAITLNRMIVILFQFIVLFVLMFLPFVHIFYRLLAQSTNCATQKFSPSVLEHYYNTFIILLNMINITELYGDARNSNYYLLLILHVCYVFVLSILLINFLIALLSYSVTDVMEHKDVVVVVQQLLVLAISESFSSHFPSMKNYFLRSRFHVEGDKIYLKRISSDLATSDN